MSGRPERERGTNPRARGTDLRSRGVNPRALGTNPHPGKAEATGQWRAAFRRIGRLPPERRHELLRELERNHGALAPELELALRRRLGNPT